MRNCWPRPARHCWTCTASDPPVRPGCWSRSATSPASPTATTSRPGTAPPPSTPPPATGRHRLSRAGNRQINRTLHIMATVQLRNPGIGRDYYDRRRAEGKSSMEAMRCLKRRLSDIVYRELLDDAVARRLATNGTGPGGHRGNDERARPAHNPTPTLRTSLTRTCQGPTLEPHSLLCLDTEGSHEPVTLCRTDRGMSGHACNAADIPGSVAVKRRARERVPRRCVRRRWCQS